jgi:hypothetical protein
VVLSSAVPYSTPSHIFSSTGHPVLSHEAREVRGVAARLAAGGLAPELHRRVFRGWGRGDFVGGGGTTQLGQRATAAAGGKRRWRTSVEERAGSLAAPLRTTTTAGGKPAMAEADDRGASSSLALVSRGMS